MRKLLLRLMLGSIALPLAGCLRRKIRVTSDPPGAVVYLNDRQIGVTPAEAEFTFYGVYDVRLDRPGYEPISVGKTAHAPVWEWPIIDIVFEMIPAKFEHTVEWHFDLEQLPDPGTPEARALERQTLERASELKERTENED
jgi:hypothetical protein